MRKLVDFIITEVENQKNLHFIIFGDMNIEEEKGYKIPIFENIRMKKIENGIETDWKPSSTTWAGSKISSEDAMYQTYSDIIANDENIQIIFIDKSIMDLVSQYRNAYIKYNGRKIPKLIYSYWYGNFELFFATDSFCYYEKDGELIMMRTSNGDQVAGAEFAEIGLYDSFDNVNKGKEKLIFGEISEEFIEEGEKNDSLESKKDFVEELPFL